jgi:RNA polymerase sigma factor (sigma-70 family)
VHRVGLPVSELPDETLLSEFGRGDDEMTVAFVRRFQRRVYGVALSILDDRELAEDSAQQAFERAWRHANTYDPRRGSVSGWLTTITRNLAIDMARTRRAVLVDPQELWLRVSTGGEGTERSVMAGLAADDLRRALHQLPVEQARAVVLSGLFGMSARQIAESERIPLGTAKTRIRTAMHRLRELLSAEASDYD